MRVRDKNDITQWFKFFLVGVIETAKNGIQTFDGILKLQKVIDSKLQSFGNRANNARKIIEVFYTHPIVNAQKIKDLTGLSFPSVYKLLGELELHKIVKEITGGKRHKLYLFEDYTNMFK